MDEANRARRRGGEFTGRHMLAAMAVGFGIVIAVNFTMAALARSSFSGVVVQNSYVASQHFNRWLEQARMGEALGWKAELARDGDGRLVVRTHNIPQGAVVSVELRRPLGQSEMHRLDLRVGEDRSYRSDEPLAPGRWIARLRVEADGHVWREQRELP